jgi:hypothetical protein
MTKKIISAIFAIIILNGRTLSENSYKILPNSIIKIHKDGKEYYFNRPSDFIIIKDKIAISDLRDDCIVIADLRGNVINVFGRHGQGPGDLDRPYKIFSYANAKGIGILDSGNYKIKIFNNKGEIIGQYPAFTMAEAGGKISFKDDGSYLYSTEGYGKEYLISHRTIEGNEISKIGNIYGEVNKIYKMETEEVKKGNIPNSYKNKVLPLFDERGNILCIHLALPIIRKFDKNGKMLWEKEVSTKEVEDIKEQWIVENRRTPPNVSIRLNYWRDAQYIGDSIYLLLDNKKQFVIYKIAENSNEIKRFIGEDNNVSMFRIHENDLWAFNNEKQEFVIYKDFIK